MDLHLLEILLAFKKYGTLSSTAEALHISQPTLTRNMQALEKEVDVPVFIHGKNSLKLNETGEFLVKESEKLLHSYEEMIQKLHILDDSLRVIHIGCCAPGPKSVKLSFILTIQLQKLIGYPIKMKMNYSKAYKSIHMISYSSKNNHYPKNSTQNHA